MTHNKDRILRSDKLSSEPPLTGGGDHDAEPDVTCVNKERPGRECLQLVFDRKSMA